jgi:hypothetical protein
MLKTAAFSGLLRRVVRRKFTDVSEVFATTIFRAISVIYQATRKNPEGSPFRIGSRDNLISKLQTLNSFEWNGRIFINGKRTTLSFGEMRL